MFSSSFLGMDCLSLDQSLEEPELIADVSGHQKVLSNARPASLTNDSCQFAITKKLEHSLDESILVERID
jgi:hypothetical protein